MKTDVVILSPDLLNQAKVPFLSSYLAAGFPSPAEDLVEGKLNPSDLLIKNKAATYFVRIIGDSMTGDGIFPNDIVVVDRSLEARNGDIIIACVGGEVTIKRYKRDEAKRLIYLLPSNPDFAVITITAGEEFEIWGVVTFNLHGIRKAG
jgi:DNA polymerase V